MRGFGRSDKPSRKTLEIEVEVRRRREEALEDRVEELKQDLQQSNENNSNLKVDVQVLDRHVEELKVKVKELEGELEESKRNHNTEYELAKAYWTDLDNTIKIVHKKAYELGKIYRINLQQDLYSCRTVPPIVQVVLRRLERTLFEKDALERQLFHARNITRRTRDGLANGSSFDAPRRREQASELKGRMRPRSLSDSTQDERIEYIGNSRSDGVLDGGAESDTIDEDDVVEELQARISTLEADKNRLEEEVRSLTETLERERGTWRTTLSEKQREFELDVEQINKRHKEEKRKYGLELDTMRRKHQDTLAAMVRDHSLKTDKLTREKNEEQQDHKAEVERLNKLHDANVAVMRSAHKTEMDGLREQYTSTIGQLKQEIESQGMTHKKAMETARQSHEETLRLKQAEKEREVAAAEGRIREMEGKHRSELNERNEKHAREESRLKAAHEANVADLKEENKSFSAALLTRDIRSFNMLEMGDLRMLLDGEIESRFMNISQDVDSLSRLGWKEERRAWRDETLSSLSSNQRLLKKQILQDCIWSLLHEYVFCSPFRIFGDEGEKLEDQWNDRCGRDDKYKIGDYSWPSPSPETERWRYITLTGCRAALKKPLPSEFDHRTRLKRGFRDSVAALKRTISSTISELVELDEGTQEAITKLTMKAVNLWIDFGIQRCRVVILLPGPQQFSMEDKAKAAEQGSVELVVVPMLKRYGNSEGLDLHVQETVGTCDGVVARLPAEEE